MGARRLPACGPVRASKALDGIPELSPEEHATSSKVRSSPLAKNPQRGIHSPFLTKNVIGTIATLRRNDEVCLDVRHNGHRRCGGDDVFQESGRYAPDQRNGPRTESQSDVSADNGRPGAG